MNERGWKKIPPIRHTTLSSSAFKLGGVCGQQFCARSHFREDALQREQELLRVIRDCEVNGWAPLIGRGWTSYPPLANLLHEALFATTAINRFVLDKVPTSFLLPVC